MIRKFTIYLCLLLYRTLLVFLVTLGASVLLARDSNYIKDVLVGQDVYSKFVPALIEANIAQQNQTVSSIPLEDPKVQEIFTKAFPAEDLQLASETIINSAYSWLEGDSSTFDFRVDFTKNKEALASGLANYAFNRLEYLPTCNIIPESIDPFTTNCLPENIDLVSEKQSFKDLITNTDGFLENPIITQESLPKDGRGRIFSNQYPEMPVYYSLMFVSIPILAGVILLLAILVVFLSRSLRRGIRKIGLSTATVCFSLILFTVIFVFVLPLFTNSLPILQTSDQGIDGLLNSVSKAIGRDYSIAMIKIGVPILLGGLLIFGIEKLTRPKVNYKTASKKSGLSSSNEPKIKGPTKSKIVKKRPPVQSSESSDTKPAKRLKNKKYRTIPK